MTPRQVLLTLFRLITRVDRCSYSSAETCQDYQGLIMNTLSQCSPKMIPTDNAISKHKQGIWSTQTNSNHAINSRCNEELRARLVTAIYPWHKLNLF